MKYDTKQKLLGFIGVTLMAAAGCGSGAEYGSPLEPISVPSINQVDELPKHVESIVYLEVPNKDFEKQLPQELIDNYRYANIVPGEKIWIVERVPEDYWLIIYTDDNQWVVSKHSYADGIPEKPKPSGAVDDNTASLQGEPNNA